MNVYGSGMGSQVYNPSAFSSFPPQGAAGEAMMPRYSSERTVQYSGYSSSAERFSAFKEGTNRTYGNNGGLTPPFSRNEHTQALTHYYWMSGAFRDTVSKFTDYYGKFKQVFTGRDEWGERNPIPQFEPRPNSRPLVQTRPIPEARAYLNPALNEVSTQYFPGDTVYGFNSNTRNPDMSFTSTYDTPWFRVEDILGNDTLDFSGFRQHQVINLGAGAYSSLGGLVNNVHISIGSAIENAIGGSGDDRILGNASNNVLTGGEGADTLSGGGGSNIFKYNTASDSTYAKADLLTDFKAGWDKIDLRGLAATTGVELKLVPRFTGRPGETVIRFNPQSGRYFLGVDLSGDQKIDFLIKSTRPFGSRDVMGWHEMPTRV
ncbi:M10 family metallopeptidase C-terminal domain-containing protein [Pseudomonas sp. OST1909]|uniref:M10 family metallopeptidase C-terminal domain-containing protein n=1 Tax=Pseudomonas sp. OST1909 TaxID=2777367 RepID=UPI001889BD5A|nr:M10 family metallopeptidase C-terminal domain-containing protein [Pseudomonas sp. OST1909]QOY73379.1 M10 family metallopeptidase C-terminal domain-containing protein [Pseudomonas sp. OST1909]